MSYVKITCPLCYQNWTVSKHFLDNNKNVRKTELAKQLCTCVNKTKYPTISETRSYSTRLDRIIDVSKKKANYVTPYLWSTMTKNNIFVNNVEEILPATTMMKKENGIIFKIFSSYKYIPERLLTFSYMGKFHETVKEIEQNVDKNKLNIKYILLKHKCQKDFRNLPDWKKFNFISDYNEDHDSSYTILRGLKERDPWYLDFLSDRLFSIFDKKNKVPNIIVIIEALIGMVIVLLEWVAFNTSLPRLFAVPIHLVNTFSLLALYVVTYCLLNSQLTELNFYLNKRFMLSCFLFFLVAASGSIAALSDFLYPSKSFTQGLIMDFTDSSQLLTRLRVLHPVVATTLIFWMFSEGRRLFVQEKILSAAYLITLTLIVASIGVINVITNINIILSISHLFFADLLWGLYIYSNMDKVYNSKKANI